ncbi:MAG: glycoside hydrolase family 2 protein [Gammaproteobacteria bacterium]|nr:glycoside hydrolase family 2 protein [Gammaproteobacteria bacterium]
MIQLVDDWFLTQSEPDMCLVPSDLINQKLNWLTACVPGTVAQSLAGACQWSLDDRVDFDDYDFWYRKKFDIAGLSEQLPVYLNFSGLATICEVWLNGQRILESNNMFLSYQVDIAKYIQPKNELYICFRSLNKALSQRRPRPRWKTKLVERQQLRWFRTTLLGRIPGWTPPIAPVGPWQTISLSEHLEPINIEVTPSIEGRAGVVKFSCDIYHDSEGKVDAVLSVGGINVQLTIEKKSGGSRLYGTLEIDDVTLWWPHTHGKPSLYPALLRIKVAEKERSHALSSIGFKEVRIDRSENEFCLTVNNTDIFCRGACWTVNDIISLTGDLGALEHTLTLMRDAGANMIRVGGTMVYEQDAFYQLCDRLGIMVWQDFMFANMDYPVDDDNFRESIQTEAHQLLARLRQYVCLAVYCGNSEIEQQAAMLGMHSDAWSNDFFLKQLPELCSTHHPGIPYVTSTPSGGALPFHTDTGVTHYYGVGAYLCSVSEVRQHNVKFTSECLGFSNMPVAKTRNSVLAGQIPVTHHPRWKERVPRDSGTGWDFEDVRDHYLKELFSVDPVQLRSFDNDKYLALSEIVSGEMMSQVFAEWRSDHSDCSGGLVWFLKDLLPGAGWGIIDSNGLPKACYYYLKRCWQPISICMTNESLNGLHLHVINDTAQNFTGELEVTLLNESSVTIVNVKTEVVVDARSTRLIGLDQLLNTFYDTTYSYHFGPSKHNVVSVRLSNKEGSELNSAYYFPNAEVPRLEENSGIIAELVESGKERYQLNLSCEKFLYTVNVDIPGFIPDDNYFHLMPGIKKSVEVIRVGDGQKPAKGYVSALNISEDVRVKVIFP